MCPCRYILLNYNLSGVYAFTVLLLRTFLVHSKKRTKKVLSNNMPVRVPMMNIQ